MLNSKVLVSPNSVDFLFCNWQSLGIIGVIKLCTQFLYAFTLHILSDKEIGEDMPDTAVPMESNEGQENSTTEQPATTNGELRRDEDKDEEDFRDMLWHKEQDKDLEDTLISVFEGVIGSTKWVSRDYLWHTCRVMHHFTVPCMNL